MKRKITIYTLLCMLFISTVSCKDDLYIDDEKIGEGECVINGTVKFKPLIPTLNGNSRSVGNAIKAINSLCVLLYDDEERKLVNKYLVDYTVTNIDRKSDNKTESISGENTTLPSAESETPRATFQLTIPYGKYYIYAVANMGDLSGYKEAIQTIEGLESISLQWNQESIKDNNQMFGYFFSEAIDGKALPLTIDQKNLTLQAWVRRAVSKVTVAFDGSKLEEGVSIYLKSVSIKDIPTECYLGKPSTVVKGAVNDDENYGDLIENGESIMYAEGSAYNESWPACITKDKPFYYYIDNEKKGESVSRDAYVGKEKEYAGKAHGENNEALFFFENMQGEGQDKRQKDEDNDGKPDTPDDAIKDGKPYGTYIEVEAFYNSDNPECLGSGVIKYRFMLGKNITTNYDAERNHHYKLTLVFNRFANDPDWHIYKERYFGVTQPKVMNYQGNYFIPNINVGPNLGHEFSNENVITVTSFDEYTETGEKQPVAWKVEYREKGQTEFSSTCDWLTYIEPTDEQKKLLEIPVTFKASIHEDDVQTIDIDENLRIAKTKGSDGSPYDLATLGGATAMNTANCYIIDAKGTYMFPLVYGNAIENGNTNDKSYKSTGTGERILLVFKNHLDNGITDPYITNNTGCVPNKAELVWQDEQNLVTDIVYVPGAYSGKGGIKFNVNNPIQGNAVIAIKDDQGRVMWSWHIWITNFTGLEEADKTIEVTNHDQNKFKFMPVNLGWCSAHGEKIRYYKEQTCDVKFTTQGEFKERIITFVKKSHIAFSLGNNLYYQWGRKDPFVGTNANWANKTWYDVSGSHWQNPTRFYDEFKKGTEGEIIPGKFTGVERQPTYKILNLLIQNPNIWHNPPRKEIGEDAYASTNQTYTNQWEGDAINSIFTRKTVYDPCPVGYQVSPWKAFTGFTTTGESTNASSELYDVQFENIADGNPKEMLYEFYTNPEKFQSIIFPESGYRDWDASAGVYFFGSSGKGYVWTAHNKTVEDTDGNNSYHLEFSRTGGYIWPLTSFYSCDGFPIRPCVTPQ